ncbi:hypothetical protein [Vibrio phage RYC]|nr:hypothetical protein [Vibrio phage RYC]
MTEQKDFRQATIFTTNKNIASVGIFEDGSRQIVVEINKKEGRGHYCMYIDGSTSNGVTRNTAQEMWEQAAIYFDALVLEVPKAFLKENYKDLYNSSKTLKEEYKEEQARKVRDKVKKDAGVESGLAWK